MLRLACCMLSFALWPMTASADPVTECHRLAADPNDPGRIGTGVAFDAIESAAAVTACLQAVDANPKDGRLAYELGRAYDAGSNFAAAENAYLRSDDLGFDLAKRNLGYLYKDGRGAEPNPKQAERWLRAAAKNGDADAMNALAWMWVVTGERLKQAERLSRRSVEASPEDASYRDTLGWIYFRLGRKADAAAELEHAIRLDPASARFHAHLGWVYEALGRAADARAEWRRALELPPPAAADDPTFDRQAIEEKMKELG